MSNLIDQEAAGRHPDRLLFTLQQLLELKATELGPALEQACNLVAATLAADKVDALLYDPAIESLVAAGTSDTPMGRRQHEIGMDRLPLANGGRCVEAFRTGVSHITGQADHDPGELAGVTQGLGIRSSLAVPLQVSDESRGVLLVSSQQPNFFSEQDLRFTEAVARWVGSVAHRGELVVEADPVRVRQALENVLANAVEHAPAGTPIEVEVAQAARNDGVWAEVTVADRGPGVDPEVLPRLFNRFAAGPGSGGLGLGLHLASQIAAAHGGTLTVESAPGQGACFTLSLPTIDGSLQGS